MSIFSILTFTTMAIILLYLKKVEEVFKFQESEDWYIAWKTMWLAAWVCMGIAILLILFEQPNVRYGL